MTYLGAAVVVDISLGHDEPATRHPLVSQRRHDRVKVLFDLVAFRLDRVDHHVLHLYARDSCEILLDGHCIGHLVILLI